MTDSILTSTKKILGLDEDYTAFDLDIVLHINSIFSTLHQLGLGPESGFAITDKGDTWEDFLGDDLVKNNVKTYIYLRLRLLFDPPTSSFALSSMQEQIKELEWRINEYRESYAYVNPNPADVSGDVSVDGGAP